MSWFDRILDLFRSGPQPERWDWPHPAPNPTPTPRPTPGPTPGPAPDNLLGYPELVLAAFNAERARAQLPPLVLDEGLNRIAGYWAGVMAGAGSLDHGRFSERISSVHPNTFGAEDIAAGQRTVAEVVASWMASPPHRANILGRFNLLGVAAHPGQAGTYWVADFDLDVIPGQPDGILPIDARPR
jgi:uncharacterized protein YkwD